MTFTVGSVAPGPYVIQVTGSSGDFAQATFTVTSAAPSITINPTRGIVGTVVSVSGSGFAPADVNAGIPACTSATAGISSPTSTSIITATTGCAFSATGVLSQAGSTVPFTFVVGTVSPGPYVIQVTGSSGDVAQATFTVTSTAPSITLNPTRGIVGTVVSVSGSGFAPADVNAGIPACTSATAGISSPTSTSIITATTGCAFSATGVLSQAGSTVPFTFVVGTVSPGPYVIQVKGSSGDVAQATFTVTSTAPSITINPSVVLLVLL